MRAWQRGETMSPPYQVKRAVIREYASRFGLRVLVETGTYLGDTVAANLEVFGRIYSIELSDELYENAVTRFRRCRHVKLLHGNSGEMLPDVIQEIRVPTLFWLDGHYSGYNTAKGPTETPIYEELRAIFGHPSRNHVILIDDARCFTGKDDYPTLPELRQIIRECDADASFDVEHDIIRIVLSGALPTSSDNK
jgi:hypothetical protein